MEEKTETSIATVAERVCAKPGCGKPIGPKNRSGKCATHFHWREPAGNAHATAKPNGSKGTARAAGEGAASMPENGRNGSSGRPDPVEAIADLAGDFVEERLNRLILSLTAAEKARIAQAWIRGKI